MNERVPVFWTMSETRALLNVWSDDNVQQQLESVHKNEKIIKYMVDELAKLGIMRTTTQVRDKLKKMRHLHKTKGRTKFPYFDEMDSVLRRRRESPEGQQETSESPECIKTTLPQAPQPIEKPKTTESSVPSPIRRVAQHPVFRSRIRPESLKRRPDNDTTKEFLSAMSECHMQWLEKETEQRRGEWEREAELRREEMKQEMTLRREEAEREEKLRREEMEARSKDTAQLTSCLMQIAKIIAKDPATS